jgi:hypothetical protein
VIQVKRTAPTILPVVSSNSKPFAVKRLSLYVVESVWRD